MVGRARIEYFCLWTRHRLSYLTETNSRFGIWLSLKKKRKKGNLLNCCRSKFLFDFPEKCDHITRFRWAKSCHVVNIWAGYDQIFAHLIWRAKCGITGPCRVGVPIERAYRGHRGQWSSVAPIQWSAEYGIPFSRQSSVKIPTAATWPSSKPLLTYARRLTNIARD